MRTPTKPIRWQLSVAAAEFGIDDETLGKRLRSSGVGAGPDGCWSTREIMGAVVGDLEAEKTRLTKAQADRAEVEAQLARREVVPVDLAFQSVSNMLFAIKRVVETSGLGADEKDSIYAEITGLDAKSFVEAVKVEE